MVSKERPEYDLTLFLLVEPHYGFYNTYNAFVQDRKPLSTIISMVRKVAHLPKQLLWVEIQDVTRPVSLRRKQLDRGEMEKRRVEFLVPNTFKHYLTLTPFCVGYEVSRLSIKATEFPMGII